MPDKRTSALAGMLRSIRTRWLAGAGLMGAGILAYSYYRLWLGDRSTGTYIAAGTGLIILTTILVWTVNRRFSRARPLAYLILAILFVSIIIGGWYYSQSRQTVMSGDFRILIAKFNNLGPSGEVSNERLVSAIQDSIEERLVTETADYSISVMVSPQVVSNTAEAQRLAEQSGADIVLWGRADGESISLYIYSLVPGSLQYVDPSGIASQSKPQASLSETRSFAIQQTTVQAVGYILFTAGYSLYQQGYYSDAADRFNEIITSQKEAGSSAIPNLDLYLYLGLSYLKMERYDLAIQRFTETIELYPDFPNTYINRGIASAALARYAEAVQDYDLAIGLDPANADAYNNRGLASYYTGKYEDAIRDYSKVIEIDPKNFIAYKNRGLAYQALDMPAEAEADFAKFAQLGGQIQAEARSPAPVDQPAPTSLTSWLAGKVQAFRDDPLSALYRTILGAIMAYLLGTAALLLSAWRFGSTIFSRSWLTTIASKPLLVIPGLGKWALFLGYRERLLRQPDIRRSENKYFGLPAIDSAGNTILPDSEGRLLHDAISNCLDAQKPVLVLSKGGGGKTTLLARLSYLAIVNELPALLKDFKPVFVTPAYYDGNLVNAISDVLRERDGVAVDRHIVQAQLESGRYLILFDGVSEVDGDQNKALQEILRTARSADFRNCRFVITSRPGLSVPQEVPVFQLQPLTSEVVLDLLSLYELDKEREYQVRGQLKLFGAKPIEPLLFSMILEQGRSAPFSRTRSQLYEKYFRRLLRVEHDMNWEGWRTILGEFANWFTLETGRRGVGLIHEQLIDRISGKAGDPKIESLIKRSRSYYGLPVENELDLLERLTASGIIQRNRRWRFTHDTFEEYFAAWYIVSFVTRYEKLPDLHMWRTSDTQIHSFLGVIEFVKEMSDDETSHLLPDLDLPGSWRDVFFDADAEE